MKRFLPVALSLLLAGGSSGQTRRAAAPEGRSCANPEAINEVTDSYFRIISGPPGGREWDRFRALSLDTARFDAVGVDDRGENRFFPQSKDEYISHVAEYLKKRGFFQREIKRTVECYARIAHVFSTYESRNTPEGKVIDRGVMSLQLVFAEGRWRIAHVMWNSETAANPLPPRYLK